MSVDNEIEAAKFILRSFFLEPDETKRMASILAKVKDNDHVATYADFSKPELKEQLRDLQSLPVAATPVSPRAPFTTTLMTDTVGASALEQYGLYGSVAVGTYQYAKASKKAYYLEMYAVEKDAFQKTQYAAAAPFTSAELAGAAEYAKKFRKAKRAWIAFPLVYIGIEAVKTGSTWYHEAFGNRK